MRQTFKVLTSLLFVAIVLQVGFAGVGAFNAIDKADKDHTITKKQIENGFDPHGLFGTIVLLLILLVAIVAGFGRFGSFYSRIGLGLVVAGVLQVLFAWLATKSAGVGFLHGINALVIYAMSALLAHRAWTERPAAAGAA